MIKVNRLFLFSVVSFFFSFSNAQQWIDITDTYIVNPRFDGDDRTTGWSGTGYGAYNPVENAEFYEKNYDTYQDISGLTPGKYRVSLDAFYRMGGASDDYNRYTSGNYSEYQYAKLYASSSVGSYEIGIAPSSSAALESSLGGGTSTVGGNWWGGGSYIPNNMEAAYYWFNAGYYDNPLECEVGDDGVLRIGVRKETTVSGDWTCLDNWQLEYYGTVKAVTKIDILNAPSEVSVGQTFELKTKLTPSDATYQKVEWTSSSSSVISVDNGIFTANGAGTAMLTAKSIDGNAIASVVVKVKDVSAPTSESLVINEIMAANVDVYRDPSTNYGSWVELYNPSSQGVKLGGLYVTDDANNLKKHKLISNYGTLPAGGFAVLNFDHHEVWTELSYRQIDFKLDVDGGDIIVSDGSNIIAQVTYPTVVSRASYARTSDGDNEWKTCGTPTPGSSNNRSSYATEQLAAPAVNRDGQFFSGSLSVNVSIPSGATLRYTTNGTTPTLENGETSSDGQFNISSTTCFRFRLFKDGYLPSPVVTRSFISECTPSIPTISVVMNKDDWDGKQNGLFSYSSLGRPGNGQTSKYNANMDWDRPVNFEYITADNEYALSQECDMATCGGWSRGWTPHSFKLKATKVYDLKNTFNYQFFEEKPYLKHKTLQIRNGGNDNGCRIKDPAIQGIVASSGLKVEHQAWQPVVVYINGSKYSVLNMREPNNKHYGYSNSGIDTDEMDQFEMSPDSGYVQMEGTDESFLKLCELSNNASNASTYEEISKLLDIDEYINYMAVELYTGNWDWPQNNVKGYRDRNDGKFRFVLFDMDGALSTNTPFSTFFGKQYYTFDTLHGYDYSQGVSVEGNRNYEEIKFVTLFKNLLQNETFKKQFVDTYCLVAGSVFEPSRVKEVVDEMSSVLIANGVNASNTANTIKNSYTQSYQSSLVSHMQSYLGLSSSAKQQVSLSSSVKNARFLINGIDVPTGAFEGALYGPVTYKAVAPAGYEFVGWSGDGSSSGIDYKLFGYKSEWAYADYDITSKSWKTTIDAFTSKGSAPLGYGKSEATSLTKNRLSYYFGREVSLDEEPSSKDKFTLNFSVDDGAVVYVNGVEAGRYNMPSGTPNDNTAASTYAPNNPDSGTMSIKASLFKKGKNYIAVEVHNNQASSSDIYWDAELIQTVPDETGDGYLSTEPEMTIEGGGTYNLVACFEPIEESKLIAKGTTPIKINEVSPANSSAVNDYFKKSDWIELYNTTDEKIDVAGMYLSDNEDKPQKYQIPHGTVNTIIEPHGHLIIWADKQTDITQLHASFKLDNADGCKVILTSEDGSWSDCLTYSAVANGTQSVGLYPDGGNDVYLMDVATINGQNTIDSYAEYKSTYVPEYDPIYYIIKFYDYDGGLISSSQVEEGSTISVPEDPERTGYTFAEWTPVVSEIANSDATYTATYSVNSYKLIYMVDNEEYYSTEVEYGADIEPIECPAKDGYEFSGWDYVPTTMPAEDVIVAGMFTEIIPDGIDLANSSVIVGQKYYSVGGGYVGSERKSLTAGIYIAKYELSDGRTISKKIIVK